MISKGQNVVVWYEEGVVKRCQLETLKDMFDKQRNLVVTVWAGEW